MQCGRVARRAGCGTLPDTLFWASAAASAAYRAASSRTITGKTPVRADTGWPLPLKASCPGGSLSEKAAVGHRTLPSITGFLPGFSREPLIQGTRAALPERREGEQAYAQPRRGAAVVTRPSRSGTVRAFAAGTAAASASRTVNAAEARRGYTTIEPPWSRKVWRKRLQRKRGLSAPRPRQAATSRS